MRKINRPEEMDAIYDETNHLTSTRSLLDITIRFVSF